MSNNEAWERYRKYNFDADEKWKQYFQNLHFPNTSDVSKLIEKYKQKYYSNNIEKLPELVKCRLSRVTVEPTAKHTASLIFLHGLGDSGSGWEPVMRLLSKDFPHVRFILPNAEEMSVTLNMGFVMPAWYDIIGLSIDSKQDEPGILKACKDLEALIEEEIQSGIPSNKIVVGGFSQGGSVALYGGLTCKKKLGGILGLSTYLPLQHLLPKSISEENKTTPLLMCHGDADQVVRYSWGNLSYKYITQLRGSEENSEFKTYSGLGHSSSPNELRDIADWLKKVL